MEPITSTANQKIKDVIKLQQKKYRNITDRFIVEGHHLVSEATKAGLVIEVFTSDPSIDGTLVSDNLIKQMSTSVTPQPIIAVCKKPDLEVKGSKILFLDNVQDPGNVGTLIRSAKAFNWDGVVVRGADLYNSKTLRSAQGANFSIPVLNIPNSVDYLNSINLPKVGALLGADTVDYKTLKIPKMILIIGNEGKGISPEVIELLGHKVYIPIDFESLNASVAGSILLNEYKNVDNLD